MKGVSWKLHDSCLHVIQKPEGNGEGIKKTRLRFWYHSFGPVYKSVLYEA